MSRARICFLGTPEISVPPLEDLLRDSRLEIVGVVTQPDRPAGRKQMLTPTAIKKFCFKNGLSVLSPESVNTMESLAQIRSWDAECAVVVAFGQMLKTDFLNLFPKGAVNVHYSLLPRWRGAAPVQRSIEAGDSETGVALQKIVLQLDAGDLIGTRRFPLTSEMNARDVFGRSAPLAGELLTDEFHRYLSGELIPVPQDHSCTTYAKKIEKAEGELDWKKPAIQLHNQVRAFVLGPGSFFWFRGTRVKVLKTQIAEGGDNLVAGRILSLDPFCIQTGNGVLALTTLQPESRNAMDARTFCAHVGAAPGDQL